MNCRVACPLPASVDRASALKPSTECLPFVALTSSSQVLESALKKSLIWCGIWASVPLVAMAQSQATDPASQVPAVSYRSVFTDTPKGVETDTLDWKAANAQVGQFLRGHIDILKWEAAQPKPPTPASPTKADKP